MEIEHRPGHVQDSDYYRCIEDYFETFIRFYDEHFSRQYGFWRPYIELVIYRYTNCDNLHNGYARVKCKDCTFDVLEQGNGLHLDGFPFRGNPHLDRGTVEQHDSQFLFEKPDLEANGRLLQPQSDRRIPDALLLGNFALV